MSSPKFRTINIATLRYYCEEKEIIETIIYEGVVLNLATPDFALEYPDEGLVCRLQTPDFKVKFDDGEADLVLTDQPLKADVCE